MANETQKIELAKVVTAYMAEHKYITLTKLSKACNVSRYMLDVLKAEGYIDKLPIRLNTSQAGSIARKTSGWGDNFYLRGTPRNREAKHG